MTTPLFLLRCVQLGLSMADLDLLSIGLINDMYCDADRVRHKNTGQRDRWYVADHHPAIVSEELWDKVQEVLAARSAYMKGKKPERKGSGDSHSTYSLSGKLFCPKCGALLHHKYANRGRQEYWVCSTRLKRPEEGCPGIWVPAEATEGWQIEGKAVVMESTDEFGVKSYSFMEKAAYERRKGCPYRKNILKGEK